MTDSPCMGAWLTLPTLQTEIGRDHLLSMSHRSLLEHHEAATQSRRRLMQAEGNLSATGVCGGGICAEATEQVHVGDAMGEQYSSRHAEPAAADAG